MNVPRVCVCVRLPEARGQEMGKKKRRDVRYGNCKMLKLELLTDEDSKALNAAPDM